MVSSEEAEWLSYLDYKLLVWSRLVAFWVEYEANHPDWNNRLDECRAHLRYWKSAVADA